MVSEAKRLTRKDIQSYFKDLVGNFELIHQKKEEEMFIQIA